jgi:hypothetical protein
VFFFSFGFSHVSWSVSFLPLSPSFFFSFSPFFSQGMSISEKYNTRAAALYRDKIDALAQGRAWSIETSPARSYQPPASAASKSYSVSSSSSSSQSHGGSSNAGDDEQRFGNGMTVSEVHLEGGGRKTR